MGAKHYSKRKKDKRSINNHLNNHFSDLQEHLFGFLLCVCFSYARKWSWQSSAALTRIISATLPYHSTDWHLPLLCHNAVFSQGAFSQSNLLFPRVFIPVQKGTMRRCGFGFIRTAGLTWWLISFEVGEYFFCQHNEEGCRTFWMVSITFSHTTGSWMHFHTKLSPTCGLEMPF